MENETAKADFDNPDWKAGYDFGFEHGIDQGEFSTTIRMCSKITVFIHLISELLPHCAAPAEIKYGLLDIMKDVAKERAPTDVVEYARGAGTRIPKDHFAPQKRESSNGESESE